ELGIDEDSIDWENTEVPTVIYILKEEKLPARITMDCKQLGDQLFDAALKGGDPEVSALLEGIGVTTSGFSVTADYSDYDAIGSIDIPEEARGAVEKE
ncbi:MAG: hypothetical protein Q4F32_10165, partial [Eubacteriales bacterium]|nr:hypothetical protein [Eubacteriales bacterium]